MRKSTGRPKKRRTFSRHRCLALEVLERRLALTVDTAWIGGAAGTFSDALNWTDGAPTAEHNARVTGGAVTISLTGAAETEAVTVSGGDSTTLALSDHTLRTLRLTLGFDDESPSSLTLNAGRVDVGEFISEDLDALNIQYGSITLVDDGAGEETMLHVEMGVVGTSSGSISVGSNSHLSIRKNLSVGDGGVGTIIVNEGRMRSSNFVVIGGANHVQPNGTADLWFSNSGSLGTLTVTGNSGHADIEQIWVGGNHESQGSITVAAGATAIFGWLDLGAGLNSVGAATVGAESEVDITAIVTVGKIGNGRFDVLGGTLDVDGPITIGQGAPGGMIGGEAIPPSNGVVEIQGNGTLTVEELFLIGNHENANGILLLRSGTIEADDDLIVGRQGYGYARFEGAIEGGEINGNVAIAKSIKVGSEATVGAQWGLVQIAGARVTSENGQIATAPGSGGTVVMEAAPNGDTRWTAPGGIVVGGAGLVTLLDGAHLLVDAGVVDVAPGKVAIGPTGTVSGAALIRGRVENGGGKVTA
jgi:hypothetical protein